METLTLTWSSIVMYSVALIVCYLLTSSGVKIAKNEDIDDFTRHPVIIVIGGIIMGFLLAIFINDPSLLVSLSFGEFLFITVVILGLAYISIFGIYILILAFEVFNSLITSKIGILSIISSCFLFLSIKHNLILFIIFIVISSIGLIAGYLFRKYYKKILAN